MVKSAEKDFELLPWCWKKLRPEWKTAFLSAFFIGLAAHLYKFTNTLFNHDALYTFYTDNDMLGSGRWLLAAASTPSSYFDLPLVNGLLVLLYIGLTAAVVADILHFRRTGALILCGGLLVAYPAVTNILFYEYTADAYMLAMLLAALSVRLNLVGDRVKWHIPVSALLLCLSCGIYQAYVSFALLLSMSHFILTLLDPERDIRDCRRWIGRQFVVYGSGLLAYYLLWHLRMKLEGVTATGYQGMDQLGIFSVAGMVEAVKKTAQVLASYLLGGNIFVYGATVYGVLSGMALLLLALLLIYAAVRQGIFKAPERLVLLGLSVLSLPFFACIWNFTSTGVSYYGVMLHSLCLLYVLVLALSERFLKPGYRSVSALLLAALVFKFVLMANIGYFELERCNRRTVSDATEMITRIHMLDDGSIKKIAFIGGGEQSLVMAGEPGTDKFMVLAHQIWRTLMIDHTRGSLYFTNILNSGYEPLDEGERAALIASGATDDMPSWPLEGSVRVIGDTAVIRLEDIEGYM